MTEEWQEIRGYEGLYSISNLGRVKSHTKKSGFLHLKERIMKPAIKDNGYLQIDLIKSRDRKKFYVHRLVAEYFIPNPNNLPCVNHIDHNRTNNSYDNLEWCTYESNNIHSNNPDLKGKRIGKYSKDGGLLEEFNSALEAAHSLNKPRGSDILRCCKGERRYAYGFSWKFIY